MIASRPKADRRQFPQPLSIHLYSPVLTFFMLFSPRVLLQIEGAIVFTAGVFLYLQLHASWLLFALLFFAPDLFMLGYLVNVRLGAALYNFAHTYLTPALLLAIACFAKPQLLPIGLVWMAHIGFDRMLSFGLKYQSSFKETHLQRV